MRILVLWADDESPNLGVRVLAAGTEALARRVWPDAEFVFYNYAARTAPLPLGSPKLLTKEAVTRRAGLADWFSAFDLVLDTRSGDSFTDIYGRSRLLGMCGATELAHRAGVPVVLTPQTVGPFGSWRSRLLARRSLATANLVMARDSTSAAVSAGLGRRVDVLATDVVFALEPPGARDERDVVLNLSGLLWQPGPHVDSTAYRRTVVEVYSALTATGRRVSLLPHVLPAITPDSDVAAVAQFQREHAPEAEVLHPASLREVREILAGSSLVIGSRMHACLNAMSVGTPAISLAYSRKFAPLMADLGWPHVLDLREQRTDVARKVVEVADRSDLTEQVDRVSASAAACLDLAADALASHVADQIRAA